MASSFKRKRGTSPPTLGLVQRFSWSTTNYEHEHLATATSIRILELQPGEGTETIKCKLSAFERDSAPPYEAISYAWGDENDSKIIRCEKRKLKVTTNLRNALLQIRDPFEVKLLWADAVCINQQDNDERGNQVRQMPLIYANAERVLVWLDLPNAKSQSFEDLFNFDFNINTSSASSTDQIGRASRILHEHVKELETLHLKDEDSYPDTTMIANAFSLLFDSPWFTRLWVVQEIGMAKSVRALIGDATIDFVDLIRFILRLERKTLLMDQLGLFVAGKANVFTTFPARSRELSGEVDDDWDFLEMLEVTRAQKSSDPRDYIYALLGHPSANIGNTLIVEPNYNKTAQGLFFEITMKIIEQTQTLRILSAVHHTDEFKIEDNAPSWVPRWSRDAYVLSFGVYRDRFYDVMYDASAGLPPVWELQKTRKSLCVQGFIFDEIDGFFRTEELEKRDDIIIQKNVDQLISAVFGFETRMRYTIIQNLLDQGQTITAGFRNMKPTQFSADFAALRLYLIREATKQGRSIAGELTPEGIAALEEVAKSGDIDNIYWAASRFCMGRKLFSTQQGMLGLGPRVLKGGDVCCILFGAPVPFILRPVGHQYKLVGEAYVHGVMKGEAVVDWMLGERYILQVIELL